MIEFYTEYFKTFSVDEHEHALEQILRQLGFDFSHYSRMLPEPSLIFDVLDSGYQGMAFDSTRMIVKINDAKRAQVLIHLLPALKQIYQERNYSESIFWDTLSDLVYRLNLYSNRHHCLGLTEDDGHWLLRVFFLNIFRLGSLQYERLKLDFNLLPFELTWKEASKERMLQGQEVLSIHIMAGVSLDQESVDHSLCQARSFFRDAGINYFYCCSWLLNPDNEFLLSSGSRILQFASQFELLASAKYKDYPLYSIFETEYYKNRPMTSLQKMARAHPKYLGVGLGVVPIKE